MELLTCLVVTLVCAYVTLGLAWIAPNRVLAMLGLGTCALLFVLLQELSSLSWHQVYFMAALSFLSVMLGSLIGRSSV